MNIQNSLDYITHTLYAPSYYHRNFDHDFPPGEVSIPLKFGIFEKLDIKRIGLIALPYIAMVPIAGKSISLGLNGLRSLTNISKIAAAELASYEQFSAIFELSLAVIAISGIFFSFKVGMMITSLADIIQSFKDCISHLTQEEYSKALKDFLSTTTSAFYVGIMLYGSLEIVIASLIIKAISSFHDSVLELKQGRYPEFIAKFTMSLIQLKGAKTQYHLLERRNFLNSLAKFQSLIEKMKASRKIDSLYDHPLTSLAAKVEDGKVVFYDQDGTQYDFGSHFHSIGGGCVKGMNLTFKTTDEYTELEFKVNHVFREKIEENILELKKLQTNQNELKEFLNLNQSNIKKISVSTEECGFNQDLIGWGPKMGHKIVLDDSTITVGSDPTFINSYNIVKIRMPKENSLYDLHGALSYLGMEQALKESTQDDIERMKLGHLFHTLSPQKALELERSEDFFSLSTDQLKEKMIKEDPSIEEKFDQYLDHMKLEDILPGRKRLHIKGLVEDLKKQFPDMHLTTMMTGTENIEESSHRLASIMQMGLISNELKSDSGLKKGGLVSDGDAWGSDDSTFVQMITNQDSYDELFYSMFGGENSIRLIIDPKILESGTYQYHGDYLGNRMTPAPSWFDWWMPEDAQYKNRDGIEQFIENEYENSNSANEVMIKDRIDPKYIQGIVVDDENAKNSLLYEMEKLGYLEGSMLFGRDIDSFIQVGQQIKKTAMV